VNHGPRLYVSDCEGPLSRNDNAFEIAERFVPAGAQFFARLSRYDDFLADVEHRPGYNAGDTLRLLPPFLLAYEVSDEELEQFSTENVLIVPGVLKLLDTLTALLPTYIISTSYTPYLRALCALTRFPFDHVRCTELALDAWSMEEEEKEWLREQALAILTRRVIELPQGAASTADLAPEDERAVAELNQLFWHEMTGRVSGTMLEGVHPIGGGAKLTELLEIAAENGATLADVMYVGDSITDVPALAAVRDEGGVALSFNGNDYALAAAEFAAASADATPTIELAKAFARGGRDAVLETIRAWPKPKKGAEGKPQEKAAAIVGVVAEAGETLAAASAAARRSVRGEPIARLGHDADERRRLVARLEFHSRLGLGPATHGVDDCLPSPTGERLREVDGGRDVCAGGGELRRRQRVGVPVEAQRDAALVAHGAQGRHVGDGVSHVHHVRQRRLVLGCDFEQLGELGAAADGTHLVEHAAALEALHLVPEELVELAHGALVPGREVCHRGRSLWDLDHRAREDRQHLLAQPLLLSLGHAPGVEGHVGAAYVFEREARHVAERAQVGGVRGRDDVGRQQRRELIDQLRDAGDEEDVLGAELLDLFVADLVGEQERWQQAQCVAGVVAGPLLDVGEKVVVARQTGKELVPRGDEALGDLEGVVVAREGPFAVGDEEAADVVHATTSL
jgi:energy-converting hydrogenase A subunit R